ncbi:unnamed protein product [Brassica napus]|nr:unnamed protein product [Brassica napus]
MGNIETVLSVVLLLLFFCSFYCCWNYVVWGIIPSGFNGQWGDGIAVGWLGHPVFRNKEGRELFVRRMPFFFLKHFRLFW